MSNGPPERFRTSEHRYFRQEQKDGTVAHRKDGQYTSERSFDSGFLHAHTHVHIPDPETGEDEVVRVNRGYASALGVVANDPEEGETITIRTTDGDEITMKQQDVADHFRIMDDEDIVKYLE